MTQQLRLAGRAQRRDRRDAGARRCRSRSCCCSIPPPHAACGGTPTGPGPASVPGVPQSFLPIYEGAAQQFGLGNDGWAYLAALNDAESSFGTDNGPGTGVLSGSNYAGAAGPMQIGIGGAATDNWDTIVAQIPPNLPGGAQPPSVYNETDAVYGAAAPAQDAWERPGTGRRRSSAGTTTRPRSPRSPSSSRSTPTPPAGRAARPLPRPRRLRPSGGQGCAP